MKKELRLKKSADFKVVIDYQKFYTTKSLVLYYKPQKEEHIRIGLSVSKKLGKAVIRNKIKRQLRMMCQEIVDVNRGLDFVILARKGYLDQSFLENKKDLEKLYKKVIIKEEFNKGDKHER